MLWAYIVFIDNLALAKQRDNALGSVCPSVCSFVDKCVCKMVKSDHYQSEEFVCHHGAYADNPADAVDQHLIFFMLLT